jgi:uncharacterized protein YkwD
VHTATAADNKRLNDGVVANVYTSQHQAGCTNDVKKNGQLQLAAQWHTDDVMANRNLDGDIGSDGSSPQNRAAAAGFHGTADGALRLAYKKVALVDKDMPLPTLGFVI